MRHINFLVNTSYYLFNYILANIIVFLIKLFCFKWKNHIWIIGGNGGHYYSDNSAILYEYILENNPEIDVFYIIEKSSPDISKVKNKKGHILYKHSLKANIFVQLAKVLICNHSVRGDIMRAPAKKIKNSFTVDLFHGVTAFKAKDEYPSNSLVIATSEYEKEIKMKWPNNTKENVVVTGFPRYDRLYNNRERIKAEKNIFYMPTYRPWLRKKRINPSKEDIENFRNSHFFNEIYNFLSNKELNDFLDSKNYKLNVFIHKNIHSYIEEFLESNNTNINILSNNTNVQNELLRSDLLITDYSSVAWDFLFLQRPVIFYQFDLEIYKKHKKSYIDMPEELFGPFVDNHIDLFKHIETFLENHNYNPQDYMNIKQRFIKYDDNKNCKRVVETIINEIS